MLFFTTLLLLFAHADKVTYPPQKLAAKGISSLKIAGVNGRLTLKERAGRSYVVKVKHSKGRKFEDWNLSVEKHGDQLVLEVFNVAFGAQWRNQVRAELYPEFDIEVTGPAKPAVIGWRDGDIQIEGWKSDIEGSMLNGKVHTRATRGTLKFQIGAGDIQIADHKGVAEIKGEKGRLELLNVSGQLEANLLSGALRAENLEGESKLELPEGHAKVEKVRGQLRAKGLSSVWEVKAAAPLDLEVLSDSGPVKVHWTSGGAKLFLSSTTGEIRVPKPLNVEIREGLKVVEGLREKTPRGQVFVRTQSGPIDWQ